MKYVVESLVVLSCVFFESECGFDRFLEKAGRDVGKATHNVVQAAGKEFRDFNEGTVQPAAKNVERAYNNHVEPELKRAEQNISKNNDRFKSWFHREAQDRQNVSAEGPSKAEVKEEILSQGRSSKRRKTDWIEQN